MSEIPFVKRLGDAIESAIASPQLARRRPGRRRRVGILALAIFVVGAGGVTVARVISDPEQLAIGSIGCYENQDLSGDIAVLGADGESPSAACVKAGVYGKAAPALLACLHGGVAVVPARDAGSCEEIGLEELPRGYGLARAKVAKLARDVAELEAAADCIPPRELAERAQALLARTGWDGWRTVLRPGNGGPCGAIRVAGGLPELRLTPALFADRAELSVAAGPPRSLERQLYGPGSLVVALMDASGERCFSLPELRDHARRTLAVTHRPVSFKLGRLPENTGIEAPRGDRYDEGCAISVGASPVYPEPGVIGVEVEIWRRPRGSR